MKTIVSIQELSEFDIKPQKELDHWRRLVEEEININWTDRSGWMHVKCPACNGNGIKSTFYRSTVNYVECLDCGTLYAPYRPTEPQLWDWYRESAPSKFWREHTLLMSDTARLEKIARPRADWILDRIAEYKPDACKIIDISPHSRALLELLTEESGFKEIIASGYTADLEGPSTNILGVKPTVTQYLPTHGIADVIIAIDSFNRSSDPQFLLKVLEEILVPGGLIFMTATVSSGFEVQSLWDESPSVIPPDKLNLPSIEGIKHYFNNPAWEIVELSTPGMFDVEIVLRAMQNNPDKEWPRVLRGLVQNTDFEGRISLIELLQSQQLTSFARFVIKKKKDVS